MNWNGSRELVDFLVAKKSDPSNGNGLQSAFNKKRLARINNALNVRPVYIPLQFNMNAAGQTNPYRAVTSPLGYDVVITGFKTDTPTRDIVLRRTESEKPLVYVGDDINLNLRTDEIAGVATTIGGGQLGVFYWPSPIDLKRNQRITVEMFKTDTTASAEVGNVVLVGFRVYPKSFGLELLDLNERKKIDEILLTTEIPTVRFLKQRIDFDSAVVGGVAQNLYTPQVNEPLLIRGIRTTLRQSTIELGITDEARWTIGEVPIWAVAAEDDLTHDNYLWFSKPVYLPSSRSVEIARVVNGNIDQSNIDAQTDNTIIWICETV